MREKLPNKKEPIGKNKRTRHLMHEARFDGKIEKSKKKATVKESATDASPLRDTDAVLHQHLGKLVEQALRGETTLSASDNIAKRNNTVAQNTEPPSAGFVEEPVTPVKAPTPDKIIVEPVPESMRPIEEIIIKPQTETQRAPDSTDPLTEEIGKGLSDEKRFQANPHGANIWSIPKVKPDPLGETLRGPISGVRTMETAAESAVEPVPENMSPEQIRAEIGRLEEKLRELGEEKERELKDPQITIEDFISANTSLTASGQTLARENVNASLVKGKRQAILAFKYLIGEIEPLTLLHDPVYGYFGATNDTEENKRQNIKHAEDLVKYWKTFFNKFIEKYAKLRSEIQDKINALRNQLHSAEEFPGVGTEEGMEEINFEDMTPEQIEELLRQQEE